MLVRRTCRYRVYPTPEQEARLRRWAGTARWLWNLALEQRLMGLARPRGEQRFYTAVDQMNELTALRAEVPWLSDVPRDACNEVIRELDKAWQRCFSRAAGKPRFKKRGCGEMGLCEPHFKAFRVEGETLIFPKLGPMKLVLHRPLQGKPKICTLKRDVDQWFVSISCEIDLPEPKPSALPAVGIDRGVMEAVADSNGQLIANPAFGEKMKTRLANAQRIVARKERGSKNREKAKQKVARLHRKVRRQRDHFLHTLTSRYAKNHGVVVVEDLRVANMIRSAKGTLEEPGSQVAQKAGLNRRILDVGWGKMIEMLVNKLSLVGGSLIKVNPAYSSQTCAACQHIDAASRRSQAEFVCVGCGHRDHADVNAARVILNRRTDGVEVCGGDPVKGPLKQKLRVVRRGTVRKEKAPQSPVLQDGDGLPTRSSGPESNVGSSRLSRRSSTWFNTRGSRNFTGPTGSS